MVDANDDAKAEMYRRVEPLTGPGRRRQWSEGAKARIVSEAMQPGAVVAVVARRWRVCPQHEQAELLAAMDGIEGVVDVEGDAAWHLAEAVAVEADHGLAHA